MESESLVSYVTRLRGLTQHCELAPSEIDREIISQIIDGGQSKEVTAKALRTGSALTLKELLEWGRTREVAELQVRSIADSKAKADSNNVNAVYSAKKPNQVPGKTSSCRNCGLKL